MNKKFYTYFLIVVSILFILATIITQFNPIEVILATDDIGRFVLNDMMPPVLTNIKSILEAISITVFLAISATFVAGILALIASMFGSENISPFPKIAKLIRAFATFLRNIPDLVWAFILFSALGIGTGVGFVALVITTFAFMTRAFIESIDEASKDATEALLTVGTTFPQRVFHSIIPASIHHFISWFLYCIEVNIRASTIIGMVGGGGIGLVLFSNLKSFKYQEAMGIILIIAIMVISVDQLTGYLRRRVMENE